MLSLFFLSCFSISLTWWFWSISSISSWSWNPSNNWGEWTSISLSISNKWSIDTIGILGVVSFEWHAVFNASILTISAQVSLMNGINSKSIELFFVSCFSISLTWIIWEAWAVDPFSSWLRLGKRLCLVISVVSLMDWINCEMFELFLLSFFSSCLVWIISWFSMRSW